MIDRGHGLAITKQAAALGISRGSVYYSPRPVPAAELAVTRRMDELHLEFPFAGGRMLRDLLNAEGMRIGRRHVATPMRRMGIEAIYRKPNTSKPAPGHKIYPYLLRGMVVDAPDKVWAMDLTYVPMARGFVYLAAVIDWFSRRVLAWRLSITIAKRSPGGMSAEPTGRRRSASRPWKRPWPATAGRRSSTPIRAASSPATTSPAC
jgi:putative transposase